MVTLLYFCTEPKRPARKVTQFVS
uniref:Uncharacterized protein n=1 Tax=Anguilla anguilla TaxID=7936 RepID=A0A0E9S5C6_ANGAN